MEMNENNKNNKMNAYQILASKALDVVLQHWMVPFNTLGRWQEMTTSLESKRLVVVKEEIARCEKREKIKDNNYKKGNEVELCESHRGNGSILKQDDGFQFFVEINGISEVESTSSISYYINSLQNVNVETDWFPLLQAKQTSKPERQPPNTYHHKHLLEITQSIFMQYWYPISYRLQQASIIWVLKQREQYFNLIRSFATLFKDHRSLFQSKYKTISYANIVVYQLSVFSQMQQRYFNLLEQLLFAMTMIPLLMEAERKQIQQSIQKTHMQWQMWPTYCVGTFMFHYIEEDEKFNWEHLLTKETVLDILRELQHHLLEEVIIPRFQLFTPDVSHIYNHILHMEVLIDEINNVVNQNKTNEQHVDKNKNIQETVNVLIKETANLMQRIYLHREEMHTQWLLPCEQSLGDPSDALHQMMHRESGHSVHRDYLPMLRDIRYETANYCDIACCMEMKIDIVQDWFGVDETATFQQPRHRFVIHALTSMAALSSRHHSYLALLGITFQRIVIQGKGNTNNNFQSHHKMLSWVSSHGSFHEMKTKVLNSVANNEENIIRLLSFLLLEITAHWALVNSGVAALRCGLLSRKKYENEEDDGKLSIYSEFQLQYAESILSNYLLAVDDQLHSFFQHAKPSLPGVIDAEELDIDYQQLDTKMKERVLSLLDERRRISEIVISAKRRQINKLVKGMVVMFDHLPSTKKMLSLKQSLIRNVLYDPPLVCHHTMRSLYIDSMKAFSLVELQQMIIPYIARLNDGILCMHRDSVSNFQYHYNHANGDPHVLATIEYMFTLSKQGIDCLYAAIDLLQTNLKTAESMKNNTSCTTLQITQYCKQIIVNDNILERAFTLQFVAAIIREVYRNVSASLIDRVQMEESLHDYLPAIILHSKNIIEQAITLQQLLLSQLTSQSSNQQQDKKEQRLLLLKCKLYHLFVSICPGKASGNAYVDADDGDEVNNTPSQRVNGLLKIMNDPLTQAYEWLMNQSTTMQTSTIDTSSMSFLCDDVLVWIERLLAYMVIEIEAKEYLIGYQDHVSNSFRFLPTQRDDELHYQIFCVNQSYLINRSKIAIDSFQRRRGHGVNASLKANSQVISISDCILSYVGDKTGRDQGLLPVMLHKHLQDRMDKNSNEEKAITARWCKQTAIWVEKQGLSILQNNFKDY